MQISTPSAALTHHANFGNDVARSPTNQSTSQEEETNNLIHTTRETSTASDHYTQALPNRLGQRTQLFVF